MKLEDTVEMMLSDDYKERFKAEYYQLDNRATRLYELITKLDDGQLDFEPTCSRSILLNQLNRMVDYLMVLRGRAIIEQIDLDDNDLE